MTDRTRAAIAHLPALKELLERLKPKAEGNALQLARRDPAGDERREYIETQIRRKFEREGIDVSSGEGLRMQGQSQALAGRRVGPEEVSAIEGIASMVQNRGRNGDDKMRD